MLSSHVCKLATASSPTARFQITTYRALSVKKHWFTVDMLAWPPISHMLNAIDSFCVYETKAKSILKKQLEMWRVRNKNSLRWLSQNITADVLKNHYFLSEKTQTSEQLYDEKVKNEKQEKEETGTLFLQRDVAVL